MRNCGECSLCCVLPAIPELGKPANTPCEHLTANGCGIYAKRPEVCRRFRCHWLDGEGTDRPDAVGAYTTRIPTGNGWGSGAGVLVTLDPTRFGRHVSVQRTIAETVAAGGDVLVVSGEKRTLVTRDPKQLALAALRELQDQDGRPVRVETA
jgi:hypothetical protein